MDIFFKLCFWLSWAYENNRSHQKNVLCSSQLFFMKNFYFLIQFNLFRGFLCINLVFHLIFLLECLSNLYALKFKVHEKTKSPIIIKACQWFARDTLKVAASEKTFLRWQNFHTMAAQLWLRGSWTKGSNKSHARCQDPFRTQILRLWVPAKVRRLLSRGGRSWIKSGATGSNEEGERGGRWPPLLSSFLVIPAHLLFNLTLSLLIAAHRMLLNMHINAQACSRIGNHLLPDEKMQGDRSRCIIPLRGPIKEMKSRDGWGRGRPKKRADKGGARWNRALLWSWLMDLWVMLTFCHRGGFTPSQ